MLKTFADILTLPPWAIFFHPPDPPIAAIVYPGRALFLGGDSEQY